MGNTVQENPVPDKSEKETSLENIVELRENISASYKSSRTVAVLLVIAAFAYVFTGLAGLESPFMLPVLFTVMIGNQVYITRIRKKEVKLAEIKKSYESKFGAIASSN